MEVRWMTSRIALGVTAILAVGLVGGCKNNSGPDSGSAGGGASGGGGNGGGSGGGTTLELSFAGPIEAAPVAAVDALVTWPAASNNVGDPSSAMRYSVYRATDIDFSDEVQLLDQSSELSLLDVGLVDDVTYYYRVVAHDPSGLTVEDTEPVSTHIPLIPGPPIDYNSIVAPVWSTVPGRDGMTVCTDCHFDNGQANYGTLSLQSWERLLIGVGTPEKPDSLITEGEPRETGGDFIEAFYADNSALAAHRMWEFKREFFMPEVADWVRQGAMEFPDLARPAFDFDSLQNQSRYSVADNGDGSLFVTFPHAQDPESEPYRGTTNDHLEYRIFAGETSNTIDWRNPVAVVERYNFPKLDESYSVRVDWPWDTGVFVVRAWDYTGNVTLNERELEFIR